MTVRVKGLAAGRSMSLFNNHSDLTPVAADGVITFPTRLDGGAPYTVSVAVQPVGQRCDVHEGTGIAGRDPNAVVSITCQSRRQFAVARDRVFKQIRTYVTDPESGLITPVRYTRLSTGAYPHRILLLPNGTTGYVLSMDRFGADVVNPTFGERQLMKFSLDPATGALSKQPTERLGSDHAPTDMAISPSGDRLHVIGNDRDDMTRDYVDDRIRLSPQGHEEYFDSWKFSRPSKVDPSPRCVQMRNRPNAGGELRDFPDDLRVAPNDRFAYAIDCAPGPGRELAVVAFEVASPSGHLVRIDLNDTELGRLHANRLALNPQGTYLYVSDAERSMLHAFRVDDSTGQLHALAGASVATPPRPGQVVVSHDGRFVYVVHRQDKQISAWRVDAETGLLTPIPGSPYTAGRIPLGMTIDASQTHIYLPYEDQTAIGVVKMDAETGALQFQASVNTEQASSEEIVMTP
ncbi:MAG TPA: beta-propeller fold lactonase family protein [Pararobbsia sp.]|nr:beta-propeller fold lactonase family protein [Pararobbsia sp.]